MKQSERRVYLIDYLLKEAGYKNEIPENEEDQRRLLRGLMNIREPGEIGDDFLKIQNEYLTDRAREKGIIDSAGLEPVSGCFVVWRGDITRLKIGAIVNACNHYTTTAPH